MNFFVLTKHEGRPARAREAVHIGDTVAAAHGRGG
jgi:hypothetical protein